MLKCSSERWVCAPQSLSAGTSTTPRLSVSLRTVCAVISSIAVVLTISSFPNVQRSPAVQGRSGPSIVYSRPGVGQGPSEPPSTRQRRYALGCNRRRAKPDQERSHYHAGKHQRIALRYGSLDERRRRVFVLA